MEDKEVSYEVSGKTWKGTELGSVIRQVDGKGRVSLRWNPRMVEAKPEIFCAADPQTAVEKALRYLYRSEPDEKLVAICTTLIDGFVERAKNSE